VDGEAYGLRDQLPSDPECGIEITGAHELPAFQ
jgi:hypothetical protein